jgi:hypothetical protein
VRWPAGSATEGRGGVARARSSTPRRAGTAGCRASSADRVDPPGSILKWSGWRLLRDEARRFLDGHPGGTYGQIVPKHPEARKFVD